MYCKVILCDVCGDRISDIAFRPKIVAIDDNNGNKEFHTKGIANMIEDPTITKDQIYGKIVTKLTILSLITKVINNQYGFFFIVLVPIVILIFGVIIDVINDKKKS